MNFENKDTVVDFFSSIPGSCDGVNKRELIAKLKELKVNLKDVSIDCLFDDLDVNDDDNITQNEFVYACCKGSRKEQLKQCYQDIDADKSNSVTFKELQEKFPLVKHVKNAEAEFLSADKDGNGTLSMDEFVDLMERCSS